LVRRVQHGSSVTVDWSTKPMNACLALVGRRRRPGERQADGRREV
jgi:hypothetical protein